MRISRLLILLVGCSAPSLAVPDATTHDASALDSSTDVATIDAPEFDAFAPHVDASSPDAFVAIDSGSDAGPLACSVVAQTGCEATVGYACRFADAEVDVPGVGAPECVASGSLLERGLLPSGVCYTRDDSGRFFDLCAPGLFCAGRTLGCRRYCDPTGEPCPAYTGHADGCDGPVAGCAQRCNSATGPILGRMHFAFPGGVGFCDSV